MIPKNTVDNLVSPNASGNKSKQTIAIISPEAKAKIKLKNFCDGFLNLMPIMPPKVVPKVPKNRPISVVFIISLKVCTPLFFDYFYFILFKIYFFILVLNNCYLFYDCWNLI